MDQNYPGIIHHTSVRWLDLITTLGFDGEFNFWTKVKKIKIIDGEVFIFKASNCILGFGEVVRTEINTVKEAWRKYGTRNGVSSVGNLLKEINDSNIPIDNPSLETELYCIILTKIVRCDPIKLSILGLGKIWNLKYLNRMEVEEIGNKIIEKIITPSENSEHSPGKLGIGLTKTRLFQSQFRKKVLENYQKRCLICGCDLEDILEAAHIVEVSEDLNEAANPKNALCLCKNHHALYDKRILEIKEDGTLHVNRDKTKANSIFLDDLIRELDNTSVKLPFKESIDFINRRNH